MNQSNLWRRGNNFTIYIYTWKEETALTAVRECKLSAAVQLPLQWFMAWIYCTETKQRPTEAIHIIDIPLPAQGLSWQAWPTSYQCECKANYTHKKGVKLLDYTVPFCSIVSLSTTSDETGNKTHTICKKWPLLLAKYTVCRSSQIKTKSSMSKCFKISKSSVFGSNAGSPRILLMSFYSFTRGYAWHEWWPSTRWTKDLGLKFWNLQGFVYYVSSKIASFKFWCNFLSFMWIVVL